MAILRDRNERVNTPMQQYFVATIICQCSMEYSDKSEHDQYMLLLQFHAASDLHHDWSPDQLLWQ